MLSTASEVRACGPPRRMRRARATGEQSGQQKCLQRAPPVQNHMVQIDRVQRRSVHILADGIHLGGTAVGDDGDSTLGILSRDGAREDEIRAAERRIVGILSRRIRNGCPEEMRRRHGLSIHAGMRGRCGCMLPVITGWGDFTGPLTTATSMRASSTAMSAARRSDTRWAPLLSSRDSHVALRESSIYARLRQTKNWARAGSPRASPQDARAQS